MLNFVLKKRQAFIVLSLFVFGFAFLVVGFLPVDLYPPISKPVVEVYLPHRGISAVEFYDNYQEEIEPYLAKVEGLTFLRGSYRNNSSVFTLEFDWSFDIKSAKMDVEAIVNQFITKLPQYTRDNYSVGEYQEGVGFFALSFYSPELVPEELFTRVNNQIIPKVKRIQGIASTSLSRIDNLEVSVVLRPFDVWRYGMTFSEVGTALRNKVSKGTNSGGTIGWGANALTILMEKGTQDPYDLANLIIAYRENVPIFLHNVADVTIKRAMPRQISRLNGVESIIMYITAEAGVNLNKLSANIKTTIADAEANGWGLESVDQYFVIDPAEFISRAVGNVLNSGIVGAVLAIIIVFLFLGEGRNTFIIAIAIPLAILIAFLFMFAFGKRINLISLGGLTLSVGMVIDSAVVIVENMYRLRGENPKQSLITTIKQATHQVQFSLIASTLTSVLVFLPLPFTSPLASAILGDLAFTVIFSLIGSLTVALWINPFLFYYLFRGVKEDKPPSRLSVLSLHFREKLQSVYGRLLTPFLTKRSVKIGFLSSSALALLFSLLFVLPYIKSELLAKPTSNRIVLALRLVERQEDIRQLALIFDQVEARINTLLGDTPADVYSTLVGTDRIQSIITLPSSRESARMLDAFRTEFQDSGEFTFDAYEWDPASLPLPAINDLELNLRGSDPKILADLMNEIRDLIFRQDWYQSVAKRPNVSPVMRLILDSRDPTLTELNLEASTLVSAVNSTNASLVRLELLDEETNDTFNVDVRVESPESREDIMNLFYPIKGTFYPLRHFFDYHYDMNLSQLWSEDEELVFRIVGQLSLDNKNERIQREKDVVALVRENVIFPDGYDIELGDTQAPITEASNSLMIAFALSVSVVFVVLAIQFNSILYPALIMLTVPLGVIGVIFSLWLFGSTLSLNSLLGMILLGGIVVNNAILIIDFYLEMVREGVPHERAILRSAQLRLVPILMTSLTTILGMVPIAMALGDGTNVIQPLGIAVAGGLFISTLFTLFMIPTLLSFIPYRGEVSDE